MKLKLAKIVYKPGLNMMYSRVQNAINDQHIYPKIKLPSIVITRVQY